MYPFLGELPASTIQLAIQREGEGSQMQCFVVDLCVTDIHDEVLDLLNYIFKTSRFLKLGFIIIFNKMTHGFLKKNRI